LGVFVTLKEGRSLVESWIDGADWWSGRAASTLPKTPSHYLLTLKVATAMFAETLDNFQLSMLLISESRSCNYQLILIL
jgi:hypothetical protein